MAVSKRTRYEVLKRDNFTCRYCRSTEGELTIDHVVPTALGGGDEPSNLVAACRDCNAGKSSAHPDAALIDDVDADALRWAAAMAKASEIQAANADSLSRSVEWFERTWWTHMPSFARLPSEAEVRTTVKQLMASRLSNSTAEECIVIAAGANHVAQCDRWKYFCGIAWNKIRDMQDMARQILAAEEAGF